MDLASEYWHIPIHPKDTEKLSLATWGPYLITAINCSNYQMLKSI